MYEAGRMPIVVVVPSAFRAIPGPEFNLHSPKSHAVIWHVYQREELRRRGESGEKRGKMGKTRE